MPAFNLAGSIVESLKTQVMSPSLISTLLSSDRNKVLNRDESDYWDYKREIDLDSAVGIANMAKDVLAFHNTKGGVLIVGVEKDYRVVGVAKSQVIDTYKIKEKLRKYTGPSIGFFQNTIDLQNNKVIWLIFVTKRSGLPVEVHNNGPQDKAGRYEIRKDEYYIRLGDQTIACKERSHYDQLYTGSPLDHIRPYLYDVDEPYFRLLAPRCDRFVGRKETLNQIDRALRKTRQPVIALDGLGGLGKTEVAIAYAMDRYKAREYDFIVSISAKNRIWTEGGVQSVRAGFSGLRELLLEIAKVLNLQIPADLDELKIVVKESIQGFNGLLLLDNLEEIHDQSLFEFLTYEIPEPVKVLVTSRVDKGIGALTISVPQMTDSEARELLYHELERGGRTLIYESNEQMNIDELLKVTGCVPLAIKWAAAIANSSSLEVAVNRLQKMTADKKEFLSFCFATMFDTISDSLSQNVALIAPRLGEHWNAITASMVLDKSEKEVDVAINELKNRGILLDASQAHPGALCMLPLTADYLRAKYKERREFRERIETRITDLFASPDGDANMLKLGDQEEMAKKLYERANQLRSQGNYEKASQMTMFAKKKSSEPSEKLDFLNGRIKYESGKTEEGLQLMRIAAANTEGNSHYAEDHLYFARALSADGGVSDSKTILMLLKNAIPLSRDITTDDIELLFEHGKDKDILDVLKKMKNPEVTYQITTYLGDKLNDRQFIYSLGRDLSDALSRAMTCESISESDRRRYEEVVLLIEGQYKRDKGKV